MSHDRFILLYKSASTANVFCSYRNRYSINTLPLSDALEWNAFTSNSRLCYLFQYDFGHKTYSVIYLLTRIYNRRTRIHG